MKVIERRQGLKITCLEEIAINPIIYSEISTGFQSPRYLGNALNNVVVFNEQILKDTAFAAGKVIGNYRRNSGKNITFT